MLYPRLYIKIAGHFIMKYGFYFILSLFVISGCTSKKADKIPAEKEVSESDLRKMIGQKIMVGFRGFSLPSDHKIKRQIENGYIGGIVLFDYDVIFKKSERNIKNPDQVKQLVEELQKNAEIPLFIAIDQEGGKVNRLKAKYGFPETLSAEYLGNLNELDTTRFYARKTARTLKNLGINVNFAPVVDVNINMDNPVIAKYERSFSDNPTEVSEHAKVWIDEHRSEGILSTLKHFPGHGSSKVDSHKGFTDVSDLWSEEELEPYKYLIKQGSCDAVMSAHIFNKNIDERYPASLSGNYINDLLKNQLNFKGIVFSDDLQMKAITSQYNFEETVRLSLLAGVDVLVYGNNMTYDETIPTKVVDIVMSLIKENKIKKKSIIDSYERIMKIKNKK